MLPRLPTVGPEHVVTRERTPGGRQLTTLRRPCWKAAAAARSKLLAPSSAAMDTEAMTMSSPWW